MAALDAERATMVEKTGSFVAVSVIVLQAISLVMPYIAKHYGLEIGDADHAALSQIQTTISNVFVAVVTYFFGSSSNSSRAQDVAKTATTANAKAIDALTPVKDPRVTELVKPAQVAQADWDLMTETDKIAIVAKYAQS